MPPVDVEIMEGTTTTMSMPMTDTDVEVEKIQPQRMGCIDKDDGGGDDCDDDDDDDDIDGEVEQEVVHQQSSYSQLLLCTAMGMTACRQHQRPDVQTRHSPHLPTFPF